jgi:hypothetical protein
LSGWAGLNRRPFGPEPNALPTALQPASEENRIEEKRKAGSTGGEPAQFPLVAFHVCLFSNMPEGKELVNTAPSAIRQNALDNGQGEY